MRWNHSIKWKITLSFLILSLGLVGLYVVMATKTFESDKIFYVFESEQAQLESLSHDLNQNFERTLFDSTSLLASFNFQQKQLNSLGKNLFSEKKEILAIEIWDESSKSSLLKIEKMPDVLSIKPASETETNSEKNTALQIQALGKQRFLLSSTQKTPEGEVLLLRVAAEFENLLPQNPTGQIVLSQNDQILKESGQSMAETAVISEILGDLNRDRSEKTSIKEVGSNKYLISSVPLKYGNLRLTSIVDQNIALKALKSLFRKSLAFILFSVLVTILMSILLSSKLTNQLTQLTEVARKIGHGDFSSHLEVRSKDEVGVLSNAFSTMSVEIERLLIETRDKVRMEQELKTAKIVQDSLFPEQATFKSKGLELSGLYATSSECGGDWWYYFEREDDVFIMIADATGHGIPAALITSAARALFSQIENSKVTLAEMATQWDRAVALCSRQKIYMTALLLQMNKTTGRVQAINASHELPFLIGKTSEKYDCKPVLMEVDHRLGEHSLNQWKVTDFTMQPGDRLVLFTDGLTSIENPKGRSLSEVRLMRTLEQMSPDLVGAQKYCEHLYKHFQDHCDGAPLSDDVTIVVIEKAA